MGEGTFAGRPSNRGLPWWMWTLVVLAIAGFVALMVRGVSAYVHHSVAETSPEQQLLEGPTQQPDAIAPLQCPESCLDLSASARLGVSADDVVPLSIDDDRYGAGDLESATVADVAQAVGEEWLAVGGEAQCSFVPTNAPYFPTGPDSTSTDPISWVQVWQTGDEVMDISSRQFPSTEDASAFLHDLHTRVAACPSQDLNVPSAGGLDSSLVQITAQSAIEVPDDVAAVGWVREGAPGPRWRSYVWDLQRGNLIVQVRVLTDGRVLEQDVATFTHLVAVRLSDLEPVTP
ncbi:hypothetical protein NY547_04805 [Cnuibacter physcomitrellae]|uniref:hypothetical protein n=1 Tax=Cnuibacter physcomitrellae TaxID=1619308 RepID=UPI002175F55E|nr:hypothetical protein [Cnuibacter physcomitrellae]MCS5496558.1 hypothetical protein [Cnuibacter physcomitrellae]